MGDKWVVFIIMSLFALVLLQQCWLGERRDKIEKLNNQCRSLKILSRRRKRR